MKTRSPDPPHTSGESHDAPELRPDRVYTVTYKVLPEELFRFQGDVFVTTDQREATAKAQELGDAIGDHRVRLDEHSRPEDFPWEPFIANARSLRSAADAAEGPMHLLGRVGGAACLLWPEGRFPSLEEAHARLAATFPALRFSVCETVADVHGQDVVWVVRQDPSYQFPWDTEDTEKCMRLVLACSRPRPDSVLVWSHSRTGERTGLVPFVKWVQPDDASAS